MNIHYKVIDVKTGKVSTYTKFKWNAAFIIIFVMGIIIGVLIK